MSKRRKIKNKRSSATGGSNEKSARRRWQNICRMVVFSTILVSIAGVGFASFKHSYDVQHDLSVIGKGKPTVVQIHDPKCQLCLRLRRNADAAVDRIGSEILFRVADITTPKGRRLQRKHDVKNVTLLLFDGSGKLIQVLSGVKDEDLLYRTFLAHLNQKSNRSSESLDRNT